MIETIEIDLEKEIQEKRVLIDNYKKQIEELYEKINQEEISYTETIYREALRVLKVCDKVSEQFSNETSKLLLKDHDYYDLERMKKGKEPFNPKYVVEYRDNEPYQIIKNWDKTKGILPEIRFNNKFLFRVCLHKSKRLRSRLNSNDPVLIKFKFDNYLNLYCEETDTYLMFNKLPYPDYAFSLNENFLYRCLGETALGFQLYNIYTFRDIVKAVRKPKESMLSYLSINTMGLQFLNTVRKLVNRYRLTEGFKNSFGYSNLRINTKVEKSNSLLNSGNSFSSIDDGLSSDGDFKDASEDCRQLINEIVDRVEKEHMIIELKNNVDEYINEFDYFTSEFQNKIIKIIKEAVVLNCKHNTDECDDIKIWSNIWEHIGYRDRQNIKELARQN